MTDETLYESRAQTPWLAPREPDESREISPAELDAMIETHDPSLDAVVIRVETSDAEIAQQAESELDAELDVSIAELLDYGHRANELLRHIALDLATFEASHYTHIVQTSRRLRREIVDLLGPS